MAYVKNQVASRVGEVDMTGVKEIAPRGVNVSLSTAEKQKAAAGKDIAPTLMKCQVQETWSQKVY